MQAYIARRVLLMVPTLIGISIIVFLMTRLTPQDAVDRLVGEIGYQDAALKEQLRQQFGLNNSLPKQYVTWIANFLTGDLGESYYTGRPVAQELRSRIPVSIELGVLGMAFAVCFGIPIGILSAVKQDHWIDYVGRGGAILLLSVPSFWLALIVITVGSRWFAWTPPFRYTTPLQDLGNNIYMMATPAIILGLGLAGSQMRLMRTQMLEVLRQDYIRTARAKGLTERAVLIRHAAKNALVPVITIIGLQITVVIAGSVVLETIFLLPGIGRYIVDAAPKSDYPVLQAVTLIIATVIVVSNLLVDLSYALLDPRVKFS
jgi:peptide/nickel transport system permease protein